MVKVESKASVFRKKERGFKIDHYSRAAIEWGKKTNCSKYASREGG